METFEQELQKFINKYSQENASYTSDLILAIFMNNCLKAFNNAAQQRETWYDDEMQKL